MYYPSELYDIPIRDAIIYFVPAFKRDKDYSGLCFVTKKGSEEQMWLDRKYYDACTTGAAWAGWQEEKNTNKLKIELLADMIAIIYLYKIDARCVIEAISRVKECRDIFPADFLQRAGCFVPPDKNSEGSV